MSSLSCFPAKRGTVKILQTPQRAHHVADVLAVLFPQSGECSQEDKIMLCDAACMEALGQPCCTSPRNRRSMKVKTQKRRSAAEGRRRPHAAAAAACTLKCACTECALHEKGFYACTAPPLTSRFCTLVVPSASAASSRMRLDRLLEPGSLTVPSMSLIGAISINSSFSVGQERAFQSMLRVRERVDCMHRHGLPPRLCSSIAHLPPLRT